MPVLKREVRLFVERSFFTPFILLIGSAIVGSMLANVILISLFGNPMSRRPTPTDVTETAGCGIDAPIDCALELPKLFYTSLEGPATDAYVTPVSIQRDVVGLEINPFSDTQKVVKEFSQPTSVHIAPCPRNATWYCLSWDDPRKGGIGLIVLPGERVTYRFATKLVEFR